MKYVRRIIYIFALLITSHLVASLSDDIVQYEQELAKETIIGDRERIYASYLSPYTQEEASYRYRASLGVSPIVDYYGVLISMDKYTLTIRLRELCKTDEIKEILVTRIQEIFPDYVVFSMESSRLPKRIRVVWE